MASRMCCFHQFVNMKCLPFPVSTSNALKFLRFLIAAKNVSLYSRNKNGESSVLFSPVCKHEMFAFASLHIKRPEIPEISSRSEKREPVFQKKQWRVVCAVFTGLYT